MRTFIDWLTSKQAKILWDSFLVEGKSGEKINKIVVKIKKKLFWANCCEKQVAADILSASPLSKQRGF